LYLVLGGIFTSVVVPLLVRAAKDNPDKGEACAERTFTVVAMGVSTPIVDLYLPGVAGSEHRVAVIFAYFFIPQVLPRIVNYTRSARSVPSRPCDAPVPSSIRPGLRVCRLPPELG
jgi:putative peptidoglycan lipid II flippase